METKDKDLELKPSQPPEARSEDVEVKLSQPTSFAPDRLIVKLKPSTNANKAASLQAEVGVTGVTKAPRLGIEFGQIPSGKVEQTISAYKNDPRFEYIEPDYIITLEYVQKPVR